jgi:hypothetical protein
VIPRTWSLSSARTGPSPGRESGGRWIREIIGGTVSNDNSLTAVLDIDVLFLVILQEAGGLARKGSLTDFIGLGREGLASREQEGQAERMKKPAGDWKRG